MPADPNAPYVPPMRVTEAFILEAACKDRGLTRAQFDRMGDTEQEELVAHYLAEQQIAKWQNWRDAMAFKKQ